MHDLISSQSLQYNTTDFLLEKNLYKDKTKIIYKNINKN